jgi:AcrR family transcriptional regulator
MYRHFQDKSALLTALMDDGLEEWGRIARQIEAKDPVRWLERLLDAYLDFALSQPHRFDAAFFLPAPRARQYPDDFVAGRSPVVAMALVRVDQAKSEGRLGPKPALEVVLTISALVQGMVSMHRAGRLSNDAQMRALYRTVVRHCLDSFSVNGSTR